MTNSKSAPQRSGTARPVIFGEVLFDTFADGAAVLGGAPFNVAWHLQGFGMLPLFVSRIGQDGAGEQVLEAMGQWEMDSAGVQIDASRPTGAVKITLAQGQPSFEILAEQAYDYIDGEQACRAVAGHEVSLLYHGTLITRGAVSRSALNLLRSTFKPPAFVDINLRAPWWNQEGVASCLRAARWAKLNDVELMEIDAQRGVKEAVLDLAATQLRSRYGLELLIVTRGAEGAFVVAKDKHYPGLPLKVDQLVDTVGAGDAFSAVMIVGICLDWPLPLSLARALRFAADICRQRGATTNNKDLYFTTTSQWDSEDA